MILSDQFKEVFSPEGFKLSWERYKRSCPKYSKDYLGVQIFEKNLKANISNLSQQLLSNNFSPVRPPKYYLPKSSGLSRSISILSIEDALVYQCLADYAAEQTYSMLVKNIPFVLGSVLHPEVQIGRELVHHRYASYYFFQPYLVYYKYYADSVNKALDKKDSSFRLETDITGFFDSIPHFTLLEKLEKEAGFQSDVLDFMAQCLTAWSGNRENRTPMVGIPQSNSSSSFFANLLLHDLDKLIIKEGIPYYRYVDDIRLFGDSKEHLQRTLITIDKHLSGLGLHLNSKKTKIEPLTEDSREESYIEFNYDVDLEEIQRELSEESNENRKLTLPTVADLCARYMSNDKNLPNNTSEKQALIDIANRDLNEIQNDLIKVCDSKIECLSKKSTEHKWLKNTRRFRIAIEVLEKYDVLFDLKSEITMPGWARLTEVYFTRANSFCQTIALYKNRMAVETLMSLRKSIGLHEWVHCEILKALSKTQLLSSKELRQLYGELKTEQSWYARKGYYILFLSEDNACEHQLYESVKALAAEEKNEYLKYEILNIINLSKLTAQEREKTFERFGVL